MLDDQRSEDVPIPAKCWGSRKLQQDWLSGDFAGKAGILDWRAIDVTFSLNGVLELLPFEQRSLALTCLSVAGKADWMPAEEAALRTGDVTGRAIVEHARLGFVAGRAVLAQRFAEARTTMLSWEEREWSIPTWFWQSCATLPNSFQDWERGRLKAEVPGPNQDEWMQLSGVHFLTELLQVLFSRTEDAQVADDIVPKNSARGKGGGRPPQTWWDDMWCDIWGLIHQGDFKPETQSDVEWAMMTWAAKQEYDLGETTARLKARKLLKVYRDEVTNFLDP